MENKKNITDGRNTLQPSYEGPAGGTLQQTNLVISFVPINNET